MDQNMCKVTSKKRAPNYTNVEKEHLLNIIDKFRNIIEKKKTDGVPVGEKKEACQKITEEFNSPSPNLHYRPLESLKKYYEKLKEDLRKRTAELKKELYKTGGGPRPLPAPNNDNDELLLSIINKKSVFGLENPFDSDFGDAQKELDNEDLNCSASTMILQELVVEEQLNTESGNNNSLLYCDDNVEGSQSQKKKNSDNIEIIFEETENKTTSTPDWKSGGSLKRLLSGISKENSNKTAQCKKRCEVPSRRRPKTVLSLTSSRLGEKYEMLVDKKLELVEGLKLEHKLRMEALQLDIQLKRKQLNSITTNKDSSEHLGESTILF